jgi:hypothetical protein
MAHFIGTASDSRKQPAILCAIAMLLIAAPAATFAWDYLHFDLHSGSREALWRDALAKHVGGTTEQKIKTGRIDVATSNEVFEVEKPSTWKQGMGQALAYAGETGKKPVLALMSYSQGPENLMAKSKATFDMAVEGHGVSPVFSGY